MPQLLSETHYIQHRLCHISNLKQTEYTTEKMPHNLTHIQHWQSHSLSHLFRNTHIYATQNHTLCHIDYVIACHTSSEAHMYATQTMPHLLSKTVSMPHLLLKYAIHFSRGVTYGCMILVSHTADWIFLQVLHTRNQCLANPRSTWQEKVKRIRRTLIAS